MSASAIDKLTYDEKVELIERLVDSLDHDPASLTPAQRAELERRLAKSAAGQTVWRDWQDLEAECVRYLGPVDDFAQYGAKYLPRLMDEGLVVQLREALAPLPLDRPGLRLQGVKAVAALLSPQGAVGRVAAGLIGTEAMPVRVLLFDKSATRNWAVGWHQDRVIAVKERREVPGFGPWSVKDGIHHVAPPLSILNNMVTIRLHLDPVGPDNSPLLYAPSTHRLGVVAEVDVPTAVQRSGVQASLAVAGDAWAYATLILHASEAAAKPDRRRVLHVDYAAGPLSGGLEWLGI